VDTYVFTVKFIFEVNVFEGLFTARIMYSFPFFVRTIYPVYCKLSDLII